MIEHIAPKIWNKNLSSYQIFDVRTPSEWREDGIISDVKCVALFDDMGLLNRNFIEEFKAKYQKNDKILAFICRSGHRSEIAASMVLDELEIRGVNLEGGILAYEKELLK
ncbi:rhodanese-like domain-containing protein [Campylobacter upsaliensis]|uniref:rhodanese-like domain-containing protein n=1 Tax=Campylobacter upsaliensis TaxID=28080 RepID=UPI00004B36FE|nr:rhodanese-like domain-containing protein [Campylobacter upsaliensis]EAL52681.1 rhodanese domain protein, putative [Campylobacter upsaliensis RM3195]MCR2113512.1 rhodanese-like domain-containing protein [Campylobacter upsaliensis]MCR2115382.1 rhodanese-like domain-containing protein [Campylobacter upsaliensis]MCR2119745.1 rhodanese-like domain-containing protein [Campylobacter upsaliensis]MCR2122435.1 rhodanese-like domain-containing protein [Campylobacter upsaliensis]